MLLAIHFQWSKPNTVEICLVLLGAMFIGAYFYNRATPVPNELELATARGVLEEVIPKYCSAKGCTSRIDGFQFRIADINESFRYDSVAGDAEEVFGVVKQLQGSVVAVGYDATRYRSPWFSSERFRDIFFILHGDRTIRSYSAISASHGENDRLAVVVGSLAMIAFLIAYLGRHLRRGGP